MASEAKPVADPDYIKYLFDPKEDYDWYFLVGNGKNNTPVERIGVVKKMLLAHSAVFRTALHESPLKEKNGAEIEDIFPDTFKNLLRYIYGFDNTAYLSFEDTDDLLYAADKYMMDKLKATLASRLMTLLSYDNICSLMNNPACYRVLQLNSEITRIIQFETRKVLTSPQFLSLSPEAFLTILEQEKLQASEMELWRSAVDWAKNRAKCDDGTLLRKELKTLLPHIRFCTVCNKDFCQDIAPTGVLTKSEMCEVILYHGNKDHKPDLLPEICNIVQPRTPAKFVKSGLRTFTLTTSSYIGPRTETSFNISTYGGNIELCSFALYSCYSSESAVVTVEIRQVGCDKPSPPVSVTACVQSPNYPIDLCASRDGEGVILLANSSYAITLSSSVALDTYYLKRDTHSDLDFKVSNFSKYQGYDVSVVRYIYYKTLTPQ